MLKRECKQPGLIRGQGSRRCAAHALAGERVLRHERGVRACDPPLCCVLGAVP